MKAISSPPCRSHSLPELDPSLHGEALAACQGRNVFNAVNVSRPTTLHLADQITLSRVLIGFVVFALLWSGATGMAFGFYLLGAVTDAFDGWVARKRGTVSRRGACLDAIADRTFILLVVLGMQMAGTLPPAGRVLLFAWLASELVFGSVISFTTKSFYLFLKHRSIIRIAAVCAYVTIGLMMLESPLLPWALGLTAAMLVAGAVDYAVALIRTPQNHDHKP